MRPRPRLALDAPALLLALPLEGAPRVLSNCELAETRELVEWLVAAAERDSAVRTALDAWAPFVPGFGGEDVRPPE